jgi:hypothetical protein
LLDSLKDNTSGNKTIDNLIQKMQLKVDSYEDIIFEWVPHNQFNNVKEIGERNFGKLYSAIWENGPLAYTTSRYKHFRLNNKKVILKCLHNSQNNINDFINEV